MRSATWRGWPTTPRRREIGRRCWSSRSPPPSRPPRCTPTARPRPSTPAPCASPTRLPAAERARLFEGRSVACYFSDQGEEAIAARQAALDIWRSLGDPLKEGENLRWLSRFYWFEGRGAEAEAAATAALEVLEPLPPGPELAMAYSNLAQLRMLAHDLDGTLLWGNRAIALAEQLGETETLIHALANVGAARHYAGDDRGAGGADPEPAASPSTAGSSTTPAGR